MSFTITCDECLEDIINTDNATLVTQELFDNHDEVCEGNDDEDED